MQKNEADSAALVSKRKLDTNSELHYKARIEVSVLAHRSNARNLLERRAIAAHKNYKLLNLFAAAIE